MFRTLFEVRVYHEFYLTKRDGDVIFNQTTSKEVVDFLAEKLKENCPSISNDLDFNIPASQQSLFATSRMKLVNTYAGFKVLIDVTETPLPLNVTGFKPRQPWPAGAPVTIAAMQKGTTINIISNTRATPVVPASYYFTNAELSGPKTYPFLSQQAPRQSVLTTYEQGEIASDNSNALFVYCVNKTASEQWQPLGFTWAVTEADRILLPFRFTYTLLNENATGTTTFNLLDRNGVSLHSLQQPVNAARQNVLLDFTAIAGLKTSEAYQLEVVRDSSPAVIHPVRFADDSLATGNLWGIFQLLPTVSDPAFSLLDDQGLLKMRAQADGTFTDIPIFEIRIPSRRMFWHYRNNKGLAIKHKSSLDPFLDFEGGMFTSVNMRSATYVNTDFRDGATTLYIPNPSSYESIRVQKVGTGAGAREQTYVEILVPQSPLFDV